MFKKINIEEYIKRNLHFIYQVNNNPFLNFVIYEKDNNIIGFIIYSLIYNRIEIEYVYVDKKFRREKIGTNLIKYVEKDANRNKCINITLEVSIENKGAYTLYKKCGFLEVATRKKYYKGIDGVLMLKKLGD